MTNPVLPVAAEGTSIAQYMALLGGGRAFAYSNKG